METPKNPCLTNGPGAGKCPHFNNCRNKEPCASCSLPAQYDDALKQTYFPTMAFMRDSSQFKKAKGKSKMEVNKDIASHGQGTLYPKYKKCVACKKEKELNTDNFGRHAKTKDGYANTCRECRSKIMTERNKYSQAGLRKDKIKEKEDEENKPEIELDFSKYAGGMDVYQEICKAAQDRLRSPKNQVMWWLMNCDFEKLQTK